MAARLKLLSNENNDDFLYSGEVPFTIYEQADEDIVISAKAEARFDPDSDTMWLELYTDENDALSEFGPVRSYNIPSNGVATNFTVDGIAVEENSRESEQIERALNEIDTYVSRQIRYEQDRRYERRRRVRKVLVTTAVSAVVVAGAATGIIALVQNFIIEPNEAAQAAREEYDQQDYQLPGEGAPIDTHPFSTLPVNEFEAIPSFGGEDTNLNNPRTVSLAKADGCVTINVAIKEGDQLYVTLPEDSLYVNYHYDTSLTENGFSVCFVEPVPEAGLVNDVEIAVQIK